MKMQEAVPRGRTAWLAAALLSAACGTSQTDRNLTGIATVNLQQVPADVACLRVEVVGASRALTRDFDVRAGQATQLTLAALPPGPCRFYGSAFGGACAEVGPGADPSWIGDPVAATLEPGKPTAVLLTLVPNGKARVAVDFKTDPVTGAPCVSTEAGCLDPADASGKADEPPPDGARMVSGPEFVGRLNDGLLNFTSVGIEERAAAAEEEKDREDRAYVEERLSDQPERLAWLRAEPEFDDHFRKAGKNYSLQLDERESVITLGKQFTYNAAASSMRDFPTHDNQANIYDALYANLPPEFVRSHNLEVPERVHALDAAEIQKLNFQIAEDASTLPLIDIDLTAPACADEEGTPANPGDQTGACKPAGLFAKKSFPLRPFATCVKNQGSRGSCVSFGISGAVEASVAAQHLRWTNLSEERLYYWAKVPTAYGDGLSTSGTMASMAASGFKFPWEYQWDYNRSTMRKDWDPIPLYTQSCNGYSGEHCSDTAHQGDIVCTDVLGLRFCGYDGSAPGSSGFKLKSSMELFAFGNSLGAQMAKTFLSLKIPVVLSFAVTPSFDGAAANGIVTWTGPFEGNRGGHATAMLGYVDNANLPAGIPNGAGGGYFIVKNSWGSCWKDGGYVYLPYAWVNDYAYSMVAAFTN